MPKPYVSMSKNYFVYHGDTDEGMSGKHNEDNFAIFEHEQASAGNGSLPVYVALVADGIGGNAGGEVASQLAVNSFVECFSQFSTRSIGERLEKAVHYANQVIYEHAQSDPQFQSMGTTIVAVAALDDSLYMVHAGDSRAYLIRDKAIYQLSLDHSRVQDLLDNAHITLDEIEGRKDRHHITRYLGPLEEVEVDHQIIDLFGRTGDVRLLEHRRIAADDQIRLQPGDTIVLCSDGLTDVVSDDQILEIVSRRNPTQAVKELIKRANHNGGPDNITAIVLQRPLDATADAPTSIFTPTAIKTAATPRKLAGLPLLLGALAIVVLFSAALLAWRPWSNGDSGNEADSALTASSSAVQMTQTAIAMALVSNTTPTATATQNAAVTPINSIATVGPITVVSTTTPSATTGQTTVAASTIHTETEVLTETFAVTLTATALAALTVSPTPKDTSTPLPGNGQPLTQSVASTSTAIAAMTATSAVAQTEALKITPATVITTPTAAAANTQIPPLTSTETPVPTQKPTSTPLPSSPTPIPTPTSTATDTPTPTAIDTPTWTVVPPLATPLESPPAPDTSLTPVTSPLSSGVQPIVGGSSFCQKIKESGNKPIVLIEPKEDVKGAGQHVFKWKEPDDTTTTQIVSELGRRGVTLQLHFTTSAGVAEEAPRLVSSIDFEQGITRSTLIEGDPFFHGNASFNWTVVLVCGPGDEVPLADPLKFTFKPQGPDTSDDDDRPREQPNPNNPG